MFENSDAVVSLLVMSFYRRRLPHWHPNGAAIFLTWRLYGSLPSVKFPEAKTPGERFVLADRELDLATTGPVFLKIPRIAELVAATLLDQRELYELYAWVIMSNHVHALLKPYRSLSEVTRWIKNTSARQANLILGRTGQPFWQDESFDHWVRNGGQFQRIVQCIENNPVKAGLVDRPEEWRWSSCGAGLDLPE